MKDTILEELDQIRSENSAVILHITAMLHNRDGLSVASLIQLRAAKKDAKQTHSHICKAGEVLRFGHYLA